MRRALALVVAPMVLLAGQAAQPPAQRAIDPAREKRLEWFREAKYGLFIHWGLYSIPAGEWNGKRSLGLGEWVMFRSTVPVKEYEKLAPRFNPMKFNADEWAKLAQVYGAYVGVFVLLVVAQVAVLRRDPLARAQPAESLLPSLASSSTSQRRLPAA